MIRLLAIILCCTLTAKTSLHAQETADTAHQSQKSPTAAALWSTVIPGAGQIYVGQTLIGFTLMGLTIGSFGAMLAPRDTVSFRPNCHGGGARDLCDVELESWSKNRGFGYAGAAAWALSIALAPYLARDYNQRHGLSVSIAPAANGATRVRLAVRF